VSGYVIQQQTVNGLHEGIKLILPKPALPMAVIDAQKPVDMIEETSVVKSHMIEGHTEDLVDDPNV